MLVASLSVLALTIGKSRASMQGPQYSQPYQGPSTGTVEINCYFLDGRLNCEYYDEDGSFTLYRSGDSRIFYGVRGCGVLTTR
jgi:hypothetical protein